MALSSAQCAELYDKLVRANNALEQFYMGKAVKVLVDQNGERVEFFVTDATLARLQTWIAQLTSQMQNGGCELPLTTGPRATGYIGFFF